MLWTFISCFSSASFRIEVASILFFIVNRCNILKLNDSCPLFSNLTRANDYGKWEMKTDMEHAGRVSVSSFISVKVGVFLRQILFYILKEIKICIWICISSHLWTNSWQLDMTILHPVLGSFIFLGLAKIKMYQIHNTYLTLSEPGGAESSPPPGIDHLLCFEKCRYELQTS